ncbi:MAG: phospholipase D-like domain-containing protein [Verrucomicrobiales bacterium]
MSAATSSEAAEPEVCPLARHTFDWLASGRALLQAKLAAIGRAEREVLLEVYIFKSGPVGDRFRDALVEAARRGASVRVLLDAFGSNALPPRYFADLEAAGGGVKWFNRPSLETWSFRNHRKLLVVDQEEAFVGGCNIGPEYDGDGVSEGWRDGGVAVRGPVMGCLVREFHAQWLLAEEKQWRQREIRKRRQGRVPCGAEVDALFVYPGFGSNALREAMADDLQRARRIAICSPYFLPGVGLRRQIASPERRGVDVRILLAGKTDVPLMQWASRSIYRFFLDRGVEIFEYQPQILHAKILLLDDVVYIGSSNLDPRSLRINFEIMLRIRDAELAALAWRQFEIDLEHSRRWTHDDLNGYRTWWRRIKQQAAYFLIGRLDPRVAEGQLRRWLRRQASWEAAEARRDKVSAGEGGR